MLKNIFIATSVLLLVTAILVLRPVPIISENKAIIEKGIVSEIYDVGGEDIVFLLENNDSKFYINRGPETGLKLTSLEEKLIRNQIVLKYPKYWTPLDWNNKTKHISKIEFNNEIVFSELK